MKYQYFLSILILSQAEAITFNELVTKVLEYKKSSLSKRTRVSPIDLTPSVITIKDKKPSTTKTAKIIYFLNEGDYIQLKGMNLFVGDIIITQETPMQEGESLLEQHKKQSENMYSTDDMTRKDDDSTKRTLCHTIKNTGRICFTQHSRIGREGKTLYHENKCTHLASVEKHPKKSILSQLFKQQ